MQPTTAFAPTRDHLSEYYFDPVEARAADEPEDTPQDSAAADD
jgi:hypothetical protein